MFERFTDRARDAVVRAQAEARSMRHGYLGTEHLLLGLATVDGSVSAHVLRRLGIETEQLRASVIREIGRGPTALADADVEALKAFGIHLDEVRERIEETFGPGALERPVGRHRSRRCGRTSPFAGHIPMTPRAKKVLELSLREALRLGHRSIGTEHILLGLVRERDGLGARILAEGGATQEIVRRAVISELARGIDPPGQTA